MELVSLHQYLIKAPHMTRQVFDLVRAACEDRMIQTQGEVTDKDIADALQDEHSFWKVGLEAKKPYNPLVGVVSLQKFSPVDGTGEIGVSVLEEYQKQGYGTSLVAAMREWAVNTLNLRRMTNFILEDSPGIFIAKKLGDTLEGVLKAYRYRNGKYLDVHVYSWLRQE